MQTHAIGGLVVRFVDFIAAFVALLLLMRLVLRMVGANPSSPFDTWIYDASGTLLLPFNDMFPFLALNSSGSLVIETTTIFAILAYGFVSWLIIIAVNTLFSSNKTTSF